MIGNIQYSYDRVVPQILFVSILNILSLLYIVSKDNLDITFRILQNSKVFLLFLGFITLSAISITQAINIQESIVIFSQYLTLFFCFTSIFLLSKNLTGSYIKFFFSLIFISCAVESLPVLNVILNKFIINGEPFLRSNDLSGFSANVNIISYSLVIKLPVLVYFAFKLNKRILLPLVYLLIISTSIVIITLLSRGAFLALVISLSFIFIVVAIKDLKKNIKPTLFVITSILLSYLFVGEFVDKADNTVQQRLESIDINTDDASINQRLSYYKASFELIKSSPLIGIGIGNWKLVSIKYLNDTMSEYIVAGYAHNDFIQIAAEIGILGMLCYLMIFVIVTLNLLKGIFHNSNDYFIKVILLAMIIVFIIDSMLNFPISRPISYVFILFVLVSSINLVDIVRDEK